VLEAHGLKLEDLSEQQRTEALNALKGTPAPAPGKKQAKSQNEVVIDLSNLSPSEKGYPAPVSLSTK
jgi:hypothetical protein